MTQEKFKGDIAPLDAWKGLAETADAVLLDVRTSAEWAFVGGPDASALGRGVYQIDWQRFPGMARNESFVDELVAAGIGQQQPIYLICRSGVRSRFAAIELASHGYVTYNIADGFEGQLDREGHRGLGGWRASGLPWKQT